VFWRDLDRRGVAGTLGLLRRSHAPGGMILIGEVCWRREPPGQATVEGCGATSEDALLPLPELIESLANLAATWWSPCQPGQLGPLRGGEMAEHPPLA
jgi:hypothetical protein